MQTQDIEFLETQTRRLRIMYGAPLTIYVLLYFVCLGIYLKIDTSSYDRKYLRKLGIDYYMEKTNTTYEDRLPEWLDRLTPTTEQMEDYLGVNAFLHACLIILLTLLVCLTMMVGNAAT